jgi:hypothetical protein
VRALLSSENFDGFGGTETYVLTVAEQLERLGHQACLYTANAVAIAEFARGEGVPVVGRAELPRDRDVVIANDAATCFGRAHRYRDPVRVFVAHSRDLPLQAVKQKRPDHTAGVDEKAAVQERPRCSSYRVGGARTLEVAAYADAGPRAPAAMGELDGLGGSPDEAVEFGREAASTAWGSSRRVSTDRFGVRRLRTSLVLGVRGRCR